MTTRRPRNLRSTAAADPAARRPVTPATSSAVDDAVAVIDAPPAESEDFGGVTVEASPVVVKVAPPVPPAPVPDADPPCRHATTRTRQRGGTIERYCERCGAAIGTGADTRYSGPMV